MFTSQSCSSCPPADALLVELAQRPDVLALSFHVTYWDRLGWRDRFSLAAATKRQRAYAATMGRNQIYTPQAVIQGRADVVGSNRAAMDAALRAATPGVVPLRLSATAAQMSLAVGAGLGGGALWLIGYDARRHGSWRWREWRQHPGLCACGAQHRAHGRVVWRRPAAQRRAPVG